jgi:hypothetical protein
VCQNVAKCVKQQRGGDGTCSVSEGAKEQGWKEDGQPERIPSDDEVSDGKE